MAQILIEATGVSSITVDGVAWAPPVIVDPPPVEPPPVSTWPPNIFTVLPPGTSVAALQTAINSAGGGQTVVCDGGTYPLGSGFLRMKVGVNLYASSATTFTGSGKIDCVNLAAWSITSADLGQDAAGLSLNNGFLFNGPWIDCNGASGLIANCRFTNQASGYAAGHGSAINVANCGKVKIINNDFTAVDGNVVGIYNVGTVPADGNFFRSCGQGYSYHNNFTDHARGNGCFNLREWHQVCGRACIEVGPTEQHPQAFDNYEVAYCIFEDFNTVGTPDGMLAISLVGLASTGVKVHDNWIRRGNRPNVKGKGCGAIEVPGNVDMRNNIINEFAWGAWHYATGGEMTSNGWFCPTGNPDFPKFGSGGFSENGGSGCNIHDNTESPTLLPRPPTPRRIASSTYY